MLRIGPAAGTAPTGRAPGGVGGLAGDPVTVGGWGFDGVADGWADASDGASMPTLNSRLRARENKLLRDAGRLRRNGVLSLFHDLSVKEKGRLFA